MEEAGRKEIACKLTAKSLASPVDNNVTTRTFSGITGKVATFHLLHILAGTTADIVYALFNDASRIVVINTGSEHFCNTHIHRYCTLLMNNNKKLTVRNDQT